MAAKTSKLLRWLNAAALIATIVVNTLANLLRLYGRSTGMVSEIYPNLFTPADWAFLIWGVIYLLLAGFILYQTGWLDKNGLRGAEMSGHIGWLFILSCLINMAWVFAWHSLNIGLSVLLMFGLLFTLLALMDRVHRADASGVEILLLQAPFSLYAGWISAALIANVAVWLVQLGWNGWGIAPWAWTVLMLLAGLFITLAVLIRKRDWVYASAVLWAYAGILVKHILPDGYSAAYPLILVTTGLCGLVLLCAILWITLKKHSA